MCNKINNTIHLVNEASQLRILNQRKISVKISPLCQGLNCIVIRELFVTTELPNDELSGIHTPDLPHLLL